MKTYSITDIGRRRTMNQDYVYASEQSVGNLKNLLIVAEWADTMPEILHHAIR